jgi:MerR family transcriptional regulator, global nitrogen regulator
MTNDKLSLSTILDSPILSRLIVGIGEVSDITGVSARQLRYWETKGLINSIDDNSSTNRKYDYSNIEKIVLIKDFLDQGFTLEAAAKRLEERIQRLNKTIVTLADKYENHPAKIRSSDTKSESFNQVVDFAAEDYLFVGCATHLITKERLKIYSPIHGDQNTLIAKPLD